MFKTEPKKKVRILPVLRAYTIATLKYPWLLVFLVFSVLVMQGAALIAPLVLKALVDTLAGGTPSPELMRHLYFLVGIFAGIAAASWLGRRLQLVTITRIESRVMADLARDAFAHLVRHSHDFFISNFVGTLTRRVTRYSRSYEPVLDSVTLNFLPALLFAIGAVTILWMRSVWLGLGVLMWLLLFMTLQVIMTRWRHPMRVARAEQDSRLTGVLSDIVSNHSAVTYFATERSEAKNFGDVVEAWRAATMRAWGSDNVMQSIQQGLAIAIEVVLLFVAVHLWWQGVLTAGDFVLIQIYLIGLIDQVWSVGNMLRRLYDAFADASEMIDILELPHSITETKGAKAFSLQHGEIAFKKVRFGFTKEHAVLDNFSFTVRGGQKVGLVGHSGAGKSTVTKLLLRLYDPHEGAIEIDTQDIRSLTLESLRRAISFVPQEPLLFHRTLRDNIVYGKPNASITEVIEASKQAHCHEFISNLPEGYDTYVGERGVKLSGGERQRVAIARAILKDSPILVLDEATSSLDSESEVLIQDALQKLMAQKTVIAIAHRLSTLRAMDRIVVMDKGNIVEDGTHTELIARHGVYARLWEHQAGGFLEE